MEIKSCPLCGAEMPKGGKCSNCAYVAKKNNGGGKGYIFETVIALVLGGLIWWGYSAFTGSGDEPGVYKPNQTGALVAMEMFVEKRLKSPASAEFAPGLSSEKVSYLGGQRYLVQSYVDSQNSFGAQIRTHFSGVVKEADGEWILESLEFQE